jgi:hypothetical protein
MKTKHLIFVLFIVLPSCEKADNKQSLDNFCTVIPKGWECEIITDNFNIEDLPQNAGNPFAIVKYKNPNREFLRYPDKCINPSLKLILYPIKQKQELIQFIKSQQIYSWCIPAYYGETKDYFVITSPCFINNGAFTDEANSLILELHNSLKSIIEIREYEELVIEVDNTN